MTLRDGRLRIATSDIVGENEWMCGIDPNPLEIVEVVPMTGWGASGMWKLRVGSSNGSPSLPSLLPCGGHFNFLLLSAWFLMWVGGLL